MSSGTTRGGARRGRALKCDGKAPYTKMEDAVEEAKNMARQYNRPFCAYYCNWCDFHHVGSNKHDGHEAVVVNPPTRRERELEELRESGFNTLAAAWPSELSLQGESQ